MSTSQNLRLTVGRRIPRAAGLLAVAMGLALALSLLAMPVAGAGAPPPLKRTGLTPVVLFPGYSFSRLKVVVHNQTAAPGCPRSGTFEEWYQNPHPSTTFSQVCRDKLLTLRYAASGRKPWADRFSNQRGVSTSIADYGKTESTPFYQTMYKTLEQAGYTSDKNIFVAGYDYRLSPDLGGFLRQTKHLIEYAYRTNGNRPVHLVGHSNGPIYAQYVLTHTSQRWKDKYIHGFTPIAGNFPGQGLLYALMFTGFNVEDFGFPSTPANAASSTARLLSSPSTYMSAADPAIFGSREIVVKNAATGRTYTALTYDKLLKDAGFTWQRQIAHHYIGFVKFADPAHFPNVDVYAEKGSGISTVVGAVLPNLKVGQVLDPNKAQFYTRDGDVNQEDLTNNAVLAWKSMKCYHFSLTNNKGVDHFSLPSNPNLLARLVHDLSLPRTRCN